MSLDGWTPDDKEAFHGYSAWIAAKAASAFNRFGRALHVEVSGLENLPAGPALLVANHAFGFDIAFATARIQTETGRRVWALGEHAWWTVPLVRRFAASIGIVDGTTENVDALLAAGELVAVLPGGLREAMKPRELRYRLLWGHRYGFVRAALRNRVPIVPVACLGSDDLFDLVGNAFTRARRLHLPFPLPRPAHLVPIPHFRALRFVVGEPIPVEDAPGLTAADDEHRARRLRREVEGAIHEMIEDHLARRAGL
ncbi:lysophospholipid acyltransferase family protein [soil metagenome]